MTNVFVLPNGQLSNGANVVKLTKAQKRAASMLAGLTGDRRNQIYEYVDILVNYYNDIRDCKKPYNPNKTPIY